MICTVHTSHSDNQDRKNELYKSEEIKKLFGKNIKNVYDKLLKRKIKLVRNEANLNFCPDP